MSDKTITITQEHLDSLLEAELVLDKLQQWGVDNWEGYDNAMRELREERAKN